MQFLTIISECGIVNGLLMRSVGQSIRKQTLCGGVIHTGTKHLESGHVKINCLPTPKAFSKKMKILLFISKVSYDLNKKSNVEQQIAQMGDSKLTHETYFHKRPAFKHEREVRLLIADNRLYIRENLSSLGVKWNIAEQVTGKNDGEIIDYLTERILSQRIDYEHSNSANVWIEDAGNISALLEGVMVHPSAPEWYVNIVQDICLQKGIRFDGQSQIYKLK